MKIIILADAHSLRLRPKSKESYLAGCINMFLKYVPKEDIQIQVPHTIRSRIEKDYSAYVTYFDPQKQGTAAAVGLATTRVLAQDSQEKVLVAYADLPVSYEHNLFRALDVVSQLNENLKKVILIGVNPTFPATKYGYIKIGKVIAEIGSTVAFEMEEFHEKPNEIGAQKFCCSWRYLWNTGYLFGTAEQILKIYQRIMPTEYQKLMAIKESMQTEIEVQVTKTIYKTLPKKSIDKAIYEKVHNDGIAVVAVDLNIYDFV